MNQMYDALKSAGFLATDGAAARARTQRRKRLQQRAFEQQKLAAGLRQAAERCPERADGFRRSAHEAEALRLDLLRDAAEMR